MKKVIIIACLFTLIGSACSNLKKATYNDDVYVDPKEEKLERERLALEKKKQEEEEARKEAEEIAKQKAEQKAKDDANPAYKDPVYDKDDYYDYQYASRLRRFSSPVYGLGYYDNYYTNYYWYNQNPYYYGTSIYTSYNWWGPSYGCGPDYGFGMSYNYGWGNPYYGYSPYYYGYNPYNYGYNPYMGYNSYWQGYHNGYYSGWNGYPYGYGSPNNGWGYYNSFDSNSGYSKPTYAPRTSHGGNNSARVSNPGFNSNGEGYAVKYIKEVKEKQSLAPKFDDKAVPVKPVKSMDNSGNITPVNSINQPVEPRHNPYYNNPKSGNDNEGINTPNNPPPVKSPVNESNPNNSPPPVKTGIDKNPVQPPVKNPIKYETPKGNNYDSGVQPKFNSGNNNAAPSGGSSPRSGGGSDGGTKRPR
jgi:hypothetical protein